MMRTAHWIILIVSAVLFSSCCSPKEVARLRFTKAQEKLFPPYRQDGIYSFSDQQGNTVDLLVTKRNKWWTQEDAWDDSFCPADYIRYESETIELSADSSNLSIQFQMSFYVSWANDPSLTWDDDYCLLNIGMNIAYSTWNEYMSVGFKISDKGAYIVESSSFHETIEINSYIYKDVVEMTQTIKNNVPVVLFYNKDYGIIQITVNNENYLSLKR